MPNDCAVLISWTQMKMIIRLPVLAIYSQDFILN